MKKLLFNCMLALLITNTAIAKQDIKSKAEPLIIGEKVRLYSQSLKEDRILNIYLPQSYATDSLRKYPVIYLFDGSIDEDFIHISDLAVFCSFSWINILPESIVVGISNIDMK